MYLVSKETIYSLEGVELFMDGDVLLIGCNPVSKESVLDILSKFDVTYKMYWKHNKYEDVVYEEEPELHLDDYTLNVRVFEKNNNKFILGLIQNKCRVMFYKMNDFIRTYTK